MIILTPLNNELIIEILNSPSFMLKNLKIFWKKNERSVFSLLEGSVYTKKIWNSNMELFSATSINGILFSTSMYKNNFTFSLIFSPSSWSFNPHYVLAPPPPEKSLLYRNEVPIHKTNQISIIWWRTNEHICSAAARMSTVKERIAYLT